MKKLKSSSGFSLAETLLAVLILLLVSVIVANGTPAARNAYEKVVIGANARVLLSTTISSMRNELTTARDADVDADGKTITYYSADKGQQSKIYLDGTPPVVMIQEYNTENPAGFVTGAKALPTAEPRMLVSERAATGDLYVTYESVAYSKGDRSITVNNLVVCRKSNPGVALVTTPALTIRFIKPVTTPEPTLTP